jgi:hypothetical protein
MILAKRELLREIAKGKRQKDGLRFDPPIPEEDIDQVSIDLRLGNRFTFLKKLPECVAEVYVNKDLMNGDSDGAAGNVFPTSWRVPG